MGAIKIIKNGNGDDVVFSAFMRWTIKVATGVAIIVLAAGIVGAATFFRTLDKTVDAVAALTLKVDRLASEVGEDRNETRLDRANRVLEVEQLKIRLNRIDRQLR